MKRIISASYKDDTPAFFSEEFFENVRRGFAMIRTKNGPKAVSLLPEDVHCIVFWTKNCSDHFIEHMQTLNVPYYIQWTITGYGKDLEPQVPEKDEVIARFRKVSSIVGPKRVIWRYDPILISDKYTAGYHIERFRQMAAQMKGYTTRCVISFFDEYGKKAMFYYGGLRCEAEYFQTCPKGDPTIMADFLEKATWTLMAVVAVFCICCTLILGHSGNSVKGSAIEAIEGTAPVLPEAVSEAAADAAPAEAPIQENN